jgi:hypothetical protein
MFKLASDTYCIIEYNGRNHLALVTSVTASTAKVFLNSEMEKDDTINSITIPLEQVIASLGITPKLGSVHGVKVEPFLHSEDIEGWGSASYYRVVPKKEKKWMYQALERTFDVLEENGLTAFLPVRLEIRTHQGKYLGYYKHSKKEEIPSALCLMPPDFNAEPEELDAIIYHEAAHGIWYSSVSSALRSQWTRMFEKRIKSKTIKQKELDAILQSLYEYGGSIKDFAKDEVDDNEQLIIKEALVYMKKVYRLSADHVENLLQEDDDRLDKYWPTQQDLSKAMPDISDYSLKSTDEFFAEGFSIYMTYGAKDLPKDVAKLMKETLKAVSS